MTLLAPATHPLAGLIEAWRQAPWLRVVELACRAGYAARGLVFVSIGAVALLAAVDLTPHAEGAAGAMEAWADFPLGRALLWLTGLGLYAFAIWRGFQALLDADGQGHSPFAVTIRACQAIGGAVYVGLAISVFGILDALEDLREPDDQAQTRAAVAALLQAPGGEWAVLAIGVFVVASGLGSIAEGIFTDPCKPLNCRPVLARWVRPLGRLGHVGRGAALIPLGWVVIEAGLHARAAVGGLGPALDSLERQPLGDLLLGATSVGLIAFGAFAFVEGRYRRIRLESATS